MSNNEEENEFIQEEFMVVQEGIQVNIGSKPIEFQKYLDDQDARAGIVLNLYKAKKIS